jgi:cell division protein FtsZ
VSEISYGRTPESGEAGGEGDRTMRQVGPVRSIPGGSVRKQRGGFDPGRLGEGPRRRSVIPKIVGGGPTPSSRATPAPAAGPPPLIPPASPAQRALQEAVPRAEPKGFTDVRILGVGGAGGNAVNRMIEAGVSGVEFIAINTDAQSLALAQARRKVMLRTHAALRLGAGGDPTLGRRAAEEAEAELMDAMNGADMVFIAAGMGGGTGTGAAPVVAQLARQQRILTVAVVTLPFSFEGGRRQRLAAQGVAELRKVVDALIVIPNDRLLSMAERQATMVQAFRRADDLLRQGVQGIADLITVTGTINLDFADVRSVMENAGRALMAVGEGTGENRARDAAQAVVNSPLLEHSITGATRILLNITGGPDLTLHEVREVAEVVTRAASPDAHIIFGHVTHPRPEVELRVTLIATGMPDQPTMPHGRPSWAGQGGAGGTTGTGGSTPRPAPGQMPGRPTPSGGGATRQSLSPGREPAPPAQDPEPRRQVPRRESVRLPENIDPMDVPPFLRRPR